MDEIDLELDAAVKRLGFDNVKEFAGMLLDHELENETDIERLRNWAKALRRISAHWQRMYHAAQNANSFRQDALEKEGF